MGELTGKRELKAIARRWAKGCLALSEPHVAFHGCGLTQEEIDYIADEVMKVAERITKEDHAATVQEIVDEYYEPLSPQ